MEIFLIILIVVVVFWPWISKWLRRYMARRAEDMVRRMAGMPSRKEEERRRKQQEKERRRSASNSGDYASGRYNSGREEDAMVSMRHYAEDVEYSETKEFSETVIVEDDGNTTRRVYREDQVSDAEYVEIKDKKE